MTAVGGFVFLEFTLIVMSWSKTDNFFKLVFVISQTLVFLI